MTQPEFIVDIGSPNAYLAHRVLPEIEARTGVSFAYRPVLLGGIFKATGNQSPVMAFANIKNKLDYEMLEIQRFVMRHGVTEFKFNPGFPINTLPLMRAAAGVELDAPDQLRSFFQTAFKGMWEDEQNFADPEVVNTYFKAAGFDADPLFSRTRDQDVKQQLIDNTASAVERGAFGVPNFFVGSEMFFGKDRLTEVEDEIRAQAS